MSETSTSLNLMLAGVVDRKTPDESYYSPVGSFYPSVAWSGEQNKRRAWLRVPNNSIPGSAAMIRAMAYGTYYSTARQTVRARWGRTREPHLVESKTTWREQPQDQDIVWATSFDLPAEERYVSIHSMDNGGYISDPEKSELAAQIARGADLAFELPYGASGEVCLWAGTDTQRIILYYDPAITVEYKPSIATGPTRGWANRFADIVISWDYMPTAFLWSKDKPTQTSAALHWRQGSSGAWNTINVSGNTRQVTIPANTLPAGSIQWYLSAAGNMVQTGAQTETYTITTTDQPATAQPLAPVNTLEDRAGPIVFRWAISTPTGSTPRGSELQFSTDGESWGTALNIAGTTYTAPASSFGAGQMYWRVRALNADGVAGAWSGAAAFTVEGAEDPPILSSNASPFCVFSWQAEGQLAWRLTIDGKEYGPYWGTEKTYTLPEPLLDGTHLATVAVQNRYGLWSESEQLVVPVQNKRDWSGMAMFMGVSSEPGAPGGVVKITWESDFLAQAEAALIYRNGELIGTVDAAAGQFIDYYGIGFCGYSVILRMGGAASTAGYYIASGTEDITVPVKSFWIAETDQWAWLELPLSENADRRVGRRWQRRTTLYHVEGASWPIEEADSFEDETVDIDAAFVLDDTAMQNLENLRGKRVLLKCPEGTAVCGIFSSLSRNAGKFGAVYTISLTQSHAEGVTL